MAAELPTALLTFVDATIEYRDVEDVVRDEAGETVLDDDGNPITQTFENQPFEVPNSYTTVGTIDLNVDQINFFGTLRDQYETMSSIRDEDDESPIELRISTPNEANQGSGVTPDYIERFLLVWDHMQNQPVPDDESEPTPDPDFVKQYFSIFVKIGDDGKEDFDHDYCCRELVSANYLNQPLLVDLYTTALAEELKKNPSEELKAIMTIDNDYTPDEEMRALEELGYTKELEAYKKAMAEAQEEDVDVGVGGSNATSTSTSTSDN